MGALRIKRVYEAPSLDDGYRVLVDRLWPRGIRRDELSFDLWLKNAAPSPPLRTWYGHEPSRWPDFRLRYWAELESRPEVLEPLHAALGKGGLTLLFAARDPAFSHARVLAEFLEESFDPNA